MPQRDKHRLLSWLLLVLTGSFAFGAAGLAVHGQSGSTPTPTNTPITAVTPTPTSTLTNTPITAVTPTPTNTLVIAETPTPTNTPNAPIHYRIVYWSLASASGRSQADRYQISGSAGQAVLGSAVGGNGLQVYSGYWGSQLAPPVAMATATLTATPSATPTALPQATPTPLTNSSISVFLPVVAR